MLLVWPMSLLQQLLYSVAIAVSPVFFGLLLIRGLDGIARRLTGFIAICLWPLGWGIASLITNLPLDFAVSTANNTAWRQLITLTVDCYAGSPWEAGLSALALRVRCERNQWAFAQFGSMLRYKYALRLSFVAITDALIIDLRINQRGSREL